MEISYRYRRNIRSIRQRKLNMNKYKFVFSVENICFFAVIVIYIFTNLFFNTTDTALFVFYLFLFLFLEIIFSLAGKKHIKNNFWLFLFLFPSCAIYSFIFIRTFFGFIICFFIIIGYAWCIFIESISCLFSFWKWGRKMKLILFSCIFLYLQVLAVRIILIIFFMIHSIQNGYVI